MRRIVETGIHQNWRERTARAEKHKADERFRHFEKTRKERLDREADKAEDALGELAVSMVLASDAAISQFEAKLDTYDTATVEALLANQQALDAIDARISDMLGRAQVLPDGRRVFETLDGTAVYDEFGNKLSDETVSPTDIDDARPRWEHFRDANAEQNELVEERQDLIDFQERLDEAREIASEVDLTVDELDALEADLEADMPLAVRSRLPDYEPEQQIKPRSDFAQAAFNPDLAPVAVRNLDVSTPAL